MTVRVAAITALWVWSLAAAASEPAVEIEYLLRAIGGSGCEFIRNDKVYEAADAEAHLRMKYDRGRRWVSNADQFIERIASESSWSGEPYRIRCPDAEIARTADWLNRRLDEFRGDP